MLSVRGDVLSSYKADVVKPLMFFYEVAPVAASGFFLLRKVGPSLMRYSVPQLLETKDQLDAFWAIRPRSREFQIDRKSS